MLEQEFGKLKVQVGSFECIGVVHEQDPNTKEIWTHQHHYVKQLKPIPHEHLKMKNDEEQVTGTAYSWEALRG